ncbi:hypothetical protein QYE76_029865 [Lolium multiflorum]|uniref:J domain-containing protein n=1 Tax=Lolium multiflorum TaxID=4521 RepID=A0AAD8QRA3_LOLMU|nr:hypothetical protein QYE76_029865 [Lolium multiflorum]
MATGGDKCGGDPEVRDDLYAVMGLNEECSEADLKVAYRKLAMKWHPDRCSSSSSTKQMEEAKEKFQQMQGAYSVLSDANKRLLYDVEMCEQDEGKDYGMGDFLDEMAHMMSQTPPAKNFEELQQLFVNMFEPDIDSRVYNEPAKGNHDLVRGQTPRSPPPSLATEAEEPSCKGINKRGSSAMGTGKPPRFGDAGASQSQPEFCSRMSDTKQAPKE